MPTKAQRLQAMQLDARRRRRGGGADAALPRVCARAGPRAARPRAHAGRAAPRDPRRPADGAGAGGPGDGAAPRVAHRLRDAGYDDLLVRSAQATFVELERLVARTAVGARWRRS